MYLNTCGRGFDATGFLHILDIPLINISCNIVENVFRNYDMYNTISDFVLWNYSMQSNYALFAFEFDTIFLIWRLIHSMQFLFCKELYEVTFKVFYIKLLRHCTICKQLYLRPEISYL